MKCIRLLKYVCWYLFDLCIFSVLLKAFTRYMSSRSPSFKLGKKKKCLGGKKALNPFWGLKATCSSSRKTNWCWNSNKTWNKCWGFLKMVGKWWLLPSWLQVKHKWLNSMSCRLAGFGCRHLTWNYSKWFGLPYL